MQKATNKNIDETDRAILEVLRRDARISMTEMGKHVHLTS